MDLVSPTYALFLAIVLACYYLSSLRHRWVVLLVASIAFYATFRSATLLLALTAVTLATYAIGVLIGCCTDSSNRLLALVGGITVNVGVLAVMKYATCLVAAVDRVAALLGLGPLQAAWAALPSIGVSFYVFQCISYLVDVYLEISSPERHLGRLALYVAFFPKLLQGPIERAGKLLPQLAAAPQLNASAFSSGLRLILSGVFKKVVVAERLGVIADAVFVPGAEYPGPFVAVGVVSYAFQIYYDFAGYSEMAIGAASLFGLKLSPNFDNPYRATSVAEFWRRWHMSLSKWLGDYLFQPTQVGLRRYRWGTAVALLATFAICGLWHGPRWTYVVWGVLHGATMATSTATLRIRGRMAQFICGSKQLIQHHAVRVIATFLLICCGWVVFRADTVWQAFGIFRSLGTNWGVALDGGALARVFSQLKLSSVDYAAIVCGMALIEWSSSHAPQGLHIFNAKSRNARWLAYYVVAAAVVLLGVSKRGSFIYFQF